MTTTKEQAEKLYTDAKQTAKEKATDAKETANDLKNSAQLPMMLKITHRKILTKKYEFSRRVHQK